MYDEKIDDVSLEGKVVRNASDDKADINLLKHMSDVGMKFMKEQEPDAEGYLMGFHGPPWNTKYHLHMHLFVKPYKKGVRKENFDVISPE